MKLRIIKNANGLYVPQQLKKGYCTSHWIGFGKPIVRFKTEEDAKTFIDLLRKASVNNNPSLTNVVWKNYK